MTEAAGTSRILTLVFTDLADSTALKTRRGDQAVGELITRHRAHVRWLAAESGGRIIDWAGDGCFLAFETPSAAVLFAFSSFLTRYGQEAEMYSLLDRASRQRRAQSAAALTVNRWVRPWFMGVKSYTCPSCGAWNLFTGDPA